MTYRANRSLGFQPWGITNPWVYADLSQPQRLRGQVSPMVFKTRPPALWNRTLPMAGLGTETDPHEARAARMEKLAIAGVTLSAISLAYATGLFRKLGLTQNRRRRRRR